MDDRLKLTPEEIGDNLDLEVEGRYPCSDGSEIWTISVDRLLEAALAKALKGEQRIRELLWATHPCEGKYGDDGELQCNRFFGRGDSIDFKRDSWEAIARGIEKHTEQRLKEALKQGE